MGEPEGKQLRSQRAVLEWDEPMVKPEGVEGPGGGTANSRTNWDVLGVMKEMNSQ